MKSPRNGGGLGQGGQHLKFGQPALGFSGPETGVKPPCPAPSSSEHRWRTPRKGTAKWILVRPDGTSEPQYPEKDGLPCVEVYLKELTYNAFLDAWREGLKQLEQRRRKKHSTPKPAPQQLVKSEYFESHSSESSGFTLGDKEPLDG